MDNLKKIIENNKVAFREKAMPEGDEGRFFNRLEKEGNFLSNKLVTRKKTHIWIKYSLSIAAVTLLLLVCNIVVKLYQAPEDEISQIYSKYIVDMVNISVDIENNIVMDNSQQQNINAITFEARPLMDVLPAEMPKEERIRIVNDYYSKKLAGVEELRTRLLANQLEINN